MFKTLFNHYLECFILSKNNFHISHLQHLILINQQLIKMIQGKQQTSSDSSLSTFAVKLPFLHTQNIQLSKHTLKKFQELPQNMYLPLSQILTHSENHSNANGKKNNIKPEEPLQVLLSKSKCSKSLYQVTVTTYRNKQTGQMIESITNSTRIQTLYDYTKMFDFYIGNGKKQVNLQNDYKRQKSISNKKDFGLQNLKNLLTQKILENKSLQNYRFVSKPSQFLQNFNLGISNSDLLINKLEGKKKQFKSQHISFSEPLPQGPESIPEYVSSLKIFQVVNQYFKNRPCWLRNVLQYELKRNGYKGQYTRNELKNVLKFVSYTYRDGPWKHVFCRFGYNPTIVKQATIYQIIIVKIKRKQVEDYEEINGDKFYIEEDNDVYDPTFREMPKKYMRIYQLCDIEDKRIEDLVKGAAQLGQTCNKQSGWFNKNQFMELQRIIKSIRQQKNKF